MSAVDLNSISAAAKAAGITEPAAFIGFALGFASSQFQITKLKADIEKTSLQVEKVQEQVLDVKYSGVSKAAVVVKENWLDAAKRAKAEKTGWTVWNGKVLLAGASMQYEQPITLKEGDVIPFNETSGWGEKGGGDHWFNINLDTPEIRKDIGTRVTGKLFTTRMPRGIDLKPTDPWPAVVSAKHRSQGRTERGYFEENVRDFAINHVWVLVEPGEFKVIGSEGLLDYYRSLGIKVHHTPIVDFTAPAFEHEAKNINDINIALMAGQNILVHCMGGTGRTGTVVVGAVSNLGIGNAVKFCRRTKSTYLEIAEQEQLLELNRKVITKEMMENCPSFTTKLILDQLEDLCEAVKTGVGILDAGEKVGPEETKVLRHIFDLIDLNGCDAIVSVSEFAAYLNMEILSGLDPAAYSNITNKNLKRLFTLIDKDIPDVAFGEDSVTFDHFLDAMNKRPKLSNKEKIAETRAHKGH